MTYKQNLHTHSLYCDGTNTLEEMVQAAIEKGFDSIGFSGHSHIKNASYCMTPEGTEAYKQEIGKLKVKYKNDIKIYCGIEYEMGSDVNLADFDYTIGAVHAFEFGGRLYDVDDSLEVTKNIINSFFGGDGNAYAKAYFERLSTLPEYGNFDILAHFDLITKFCDKEELFNINSKIYTSSAVEAAEALSGKIPFFEVNTGAVSRGYRKTPYPAPFIIKELKRLGFGAVVTSDCHNKDFLDCSFCEADELLKECGFKEKYILTESGFKPIAIK